MKKFSVKPRLTHARDFLISNNTESKEFFYLGRLAESGQLVDINFDVSVPQVVAIFGKRGSGKSYTLGSILEGLCTKDKKTSISNISKNKSALLFDTLGIFQWFDIPLKAGFQQKVIKEQLALQRGWDIKSEDLDTQIWSPKGYCNNERFKEFTINCDDFNASDWGYLLGVDILQDRMGQLLNDVYEKVTNEGWRDKNKNYAAISEYILEGMVDCLKSDLEVISNYHNETRRAVIQQLSTYVRNPLFQPKHKNSISNIGETISINNLLLPGILSIILLHKLSDELRLVIIMSLIRKIMRLRIETSEIEKNLKILPETYLRDKKIMEEKLLQGIPPSWIVIDEAQNFLPSEKKTSATDTLIKFVREGRNYGLSFLITTQQPSAIDQRILSQVDTLITHKLTVQGDIEYIKRNLKSGLPAEIKFSNKNLTIDELLRSLDVGQALISNTESNRSFIIDIRPRVSVHGGFGI